MSDVGSPPSARASAGVYRSRDDRDRRRAAPMIVHADEGYPPGPPHRPVDDAMYNPHRDNYQDDHRRRYYENGNGDPRYDRRREDDEQRRRYNEREHIYARRTDERSYERDHPSRRQDRNMTDAREDSYRQPLAQPAPYYDPPSSSYRSPQPPSASPKHKSETRSPTQSRLSYPDPRSGSASFSHLYSPPSRSRPAFEERKFYYDYDSPPRRPTRIHDDARDRSPSAQPALPGRPTHTYANGRSGESVLSPPQGTGAPAAVPLHSLISENAELGPRPHLNPSHSPEAYHSGSHHRSRPLPEYRHDSMEPRQSTNGRPLRSDFACNDDPYYGRSHASSSNGYRRDDMYSTRSSASVSHRPAVSMRDAVHVDHRGHVTIRIPPQTEFEARQMFGWVQTELDILNERRERQYISDLRFHLSGLMPLERRRVAEAMEDWEPRYGKRWETLIRRHKAEKRAQEPTPLHADEIKLALENKRRAKAAVKTSRARAKLAKLNQAEEEVDDDLLGLMDEDGTPAEGRKNLEGRDGADGYDDDDLEDADDDAADGFGGESPTSKGSGAPRTAAATAARKLQSKRKGKKEEAGAPEEALYHNPPRYNKDGSLRKKPGPPKGTKKPPPRNKQVQHIQREASTSGKAKSSRQGSPIDDDLAQIEDLAEPVRSGKRRKLSAAVDAFYSDSEESEDIPLSRRRVKDLEHELDDELVDLLDGSSDEGQAASRAVSPTARRARMRSLSVDDEESAQLGVDVLDEDAARQAETDTALPLAVEEEEDDDHISDYESPGPGQPVNNAIAIARHARVEYMQHLIWKDIVTYQIPRVRRHVNAVVSNRLENTRRIAVAVSRAQRKYASRTFRTPKDIQLRARKAAKEALAFWKRNEKEEIEARKRAEREALEKAKAEEAARDRARAANRLNYLLGAGELYSKLMKKKIKTDEAMDAPETMPDPSRNLADDVALQGADTLADTETPQDLDEADEEADQADATEEQIRRRAAARARAIMEKNAQDAAAFDKAVMVEREEAEAAANAENGLTTESLDFQNPLEGETSKRVTQPKMLQAQLKEYQIKGLSWLANLYESGINGILADEMGLGKTIQSISLLAWLAENQNIWGPFLVVAPASTVHNWQQELARFVPRLKAIPYWGQPSDRKVLRRDWSRKTITFTEDAPFHIVVTSYDMAVLDHSYFQKVRWQYMVLDEAQAVKNASSQRWMSLLSLRTRNRLLLTGTPIQNSMNELWALLHFIMPDLFNSLEDFTEWFSKGIEGVAGGRDTSLSSQQLKRLHDVLRPFMLRRVKKNVQSELGDKIEKDLIVELSPRQKSMYRALRNNASVRALLAQAADMSDSATKAKSLMNIVMQFRKVCNHPDLFERADVASPFCFGRFSSSGELVRQTSLYCPDSIKNPIEFVLPRLVWEEGGMTWRPNERNRAGFDTRYLRNLMSIWQPANIADALKTETFLLPSVADVTHQFNDHPLVQGLVRQVRTNLNPQFQVEGRRPLADISCQAWRSSYLSRPDARFALEEAVAPAISIVCSSRTFMNHIEMAKKDPIAELALYGLPPPSNDDETAVDRLQTIVPLVPPSGLLSTSPPEQAPFSNMRFPNMKRLIFDSAKLARLDSLLRELKAEGHRCLIYFQMTRMMSIMEEFLVYRQYKYLRLDGSTAIGDRRDMVNSWQTNPDLFVFLLSTKAGGLGINLTAADTVIFYDHDWNPSNDSQAMDRAHRLGQTRQVTVYRLICRGTVDERILHLARNKKDVQDIVVGNKSLADIQSQKEIVSMLLEDDEEDVGASSEAFGRGSFKTGFGNPSFDGDEDEDGLFGSSTKKKAEGPGAEGDAPPKKKGRKAAETNGEKKKRGRRKAEGGAEGEPKAKRVRTKGRKSGAASAVEGTPVVTPSVPATGATTPDVAMD